jgi:hypothetical protein
LISTIFFSLRPKPYSIHSISKSSQHGTWQFSASTWLWYLSRATLTPI